MNVGAVLNKFKAITLEEMEGVKLMNRTDIKFAFNIEQFELIIQEVLNDYRVLEIEGNRLCKYKTLYYDTENHNFYTKHHNGHLNRYKIRHRSYLESNIGFLEVKFKNNKGRTIKDRIKYNEVPKSWDTESLNFLNEMLPFDPNTLAPEIWVNYSRFTLVNNNSPERLTIDLNLEFEKNRQSKTFEGLVIAEVKQEGKAASPFLNVMKKMHIREGSMSKYCMAIASMCDDVKKNNFKEKLINIKNILNDYTVTNR